jgi:hypothetical protein
MLLNPNLGSVQLPLLLVELILLAATLVLIIMTRTEFRTKGELMRHVSLATESITRQEYFTSVIDTIQASKRDIFATVTATPPSPEESDVIAIILDSVSKAVDRGVCVRYLMPWSPDRLLMARRYKTAGAEVRFHPALIVNDARFMIVDDRTVVIGVPDRNGKDQPTKRGHNITSESISSLFRERFESLWDSEEAKSYSQYLLELVTRARQTNPNFSADVIAKNLRVEREDIEYVDAIVTDNVLKSKRRQIRE